MDCSHTQNTKSLRILFWNARSINQRKHELPTILKSIDIFLCVESWLKDSDDNKNFMFASGFVQLKKNRQHSRGGGILIMVRRAIAFREISIHSPDPSVELCGIKLTNTNPVLDIIVCYRAPGLILTQSQWDTIVSNINKNYSSILIGDFNCHNVIWNCDSTDKNGERLAESIDNNDLFLHNSNTITRCDPTNNNHSNIDLVFSTLNIAQNISTYVYDETLGSDHYPVLCTIDLDKNLYIQKSFKIKTKRTNWDIFTNELNSNFYTFFTAEYESYSPRQKYETFVDVLIKCLKTSTPAKRFDSQKKLKNPVPWWDDECDRIKRLRKAAFKKWKFSQDLDDHITYKKLNSVAIKTFKTKKKECFRKFAETINLQMNTSYVWNKCKIFKNKWTKIQPTNVNNNLQNKNNIDVALNKICSPWCETNPEWIPSCKDSQFFDRPFDLVEFNTILESKKNKSASGRDGLDYEIIKKIPLNYKLILIDIFNDLYKNNNYPEAWKVSYIHFIEKPNNKGVRPISLTSSLGKLFESLIKIRLQWFCEYENLLPNSQAGFRKGRSCIDNIADITLQADEALSRKKDFLAVFLDVSGAFDNVNCDILLQKLADIGCSKSIVKFVKFITHCRYIFTESLGDEYRYSYKGVPQGGVLSPLLYLIYVKDITIDLPKSFTVSQFADDICGYCKYGSLQRSKTIITKAVSILNQNLYKLGLELAPDKCIFMHFNNKNILPGETEIKIANHTVKSSATVRFLGIIFDYKLSFIPHINMLKQKCSTRMNILKFLCGVKWGSNPSTLIILYKSFVRSVIDYGCFAYFPKNKVYIEMLNKIQLANLRIAMGYRISTPSNIILTESKIQSIRERTKFLCKCYLAKIISNSSLVIFNTIRKTHTFLTKNRSNKTLRLLNSCILEIYSMQIQSQANYNIYIFNYNTITTSIHINSDLGKKIKVSSNPNKILNDYLDKTSTHGIYTDGSKNDNDFVGSACVYPLANIELGRSTSKIASVFTAECIAIYEALIIIRQSDHNKFAIISDSLSALQSLNSVKICTRVNYYIFKIKELYNILTSADYKKSIEFVWVPSHTSVAGNEAADFVAKTHTNNSPSTYNILPYTDYFQNFKETSIFETNKYCIEQGNHKGKKYFQNFFTTCRRTWFANSTYSRNIVVTINRCRADHYNLAASLAKIKLVSDPICECGEYEEDLNHLIWQCRLYNKQRTLLISKLRKLNVYLPLQTECVLRLPNTSICKNIVEFLISCKKFI